MIVAALPAAPPAPLAPMAEAAVAPPLAGGIAAPSRLLGGSSRRVRIHIRGRKLNVLIGHRAVVSGALRPHLRGARVAVRLLVGGRWRAVAHTHTAAGGRFRLSYAPRRTGSWSAEVRLSAVSTLAAGSRRTLSHRIGRLSSYRLAGASWYGGGGYLACGGELTSSTLGVANRTLPCGTEVRLRYEGRSVRVPVIDRGPYVAGREFDLTEATKRELGFADVGEVWTTR